MANTNAPFGFQVVHSGNSFTPSFGLTKLRIASTDTSACFYGDPVMPVIGTATGYTTRYVAGTTVLSGIFQGCTYLSTAQKRQVWSNYWPGSDATGDVTAYVITDPMAQFLVQGDATNFIISGTLSTFTTSPIGQYAGVTMGAGTTANGFSTAFLSSKGTTNTLPFIVVDLITAPPGANGADPTTGYNQVIVGFNNEWLRTNSAVTGIS